MSQEFKNRVFGAVILKSINSNYNADFTHHPRTLPDGVVYSTDKALKYSIKDYFRKITGTNKLFYIKNYNDNLNPFTLDETYKYMFGDYPKENGKNKDEIKRIIVLSNLLSCLDIRLFGATFAGETNLSIHGPVQFNHGINRFPENDIYTEDILSPFRNPGKENAEEKGMSTIGNQTNLKEGHYVFHFSINPKNTVEFYDKINREKQHLEKLFLSEEDIKIFKNAINSAVTAQDSSRKIGTENEATIWIQLKENSFKMLPVLTDLISIQKQNDAIVIDVTKVNENINIIEKDIEKVEVYFNPTTTRITGLKEGGKISYHNILID